MWHPLQYKFSCLPWQQQISNTSTLYEQILSLIKPFVSAQYTVENLVKMNLKPPSSKKLLFLIRPNPKKFQICNGDIYEIWLTLLCKTMTHFNFKYQLNFTATTQNTETACTLIFRLALFYFIFSFLYGSFFTKAKHWSSHGRKSILNDVVFC